MRFSLKDLFWAVSAACLYLAALGIFIDARASEASGIPVSGFRLIVAIVAFLILWLDTGAVIGGVIGKFQGNTKRGASLGIDIIVIISLLILLVSLLMPAVS